MKIPNGSLSTAVEVVGLGLVVWAAFAWALLAGVAVSGVVLVLLGAVLGMRSSL